MSCKIICNKTNTTILGHSDWLEACIKVSAISHFMGVLLGEDVEYSSKSGHTVVQLKGSEEWHKKTFFIYQNELRKLAERYHDISFEKR